MLCTEHIIIHMSIAVATSSCLCEIYRTLLNTIQYFVHLNLAIALLLALVIFVGGIEKATENEVLFI